MNPQNSSKAAGIANVQSLFGSAHEDGVLSKAAVSVFSIPDIANQINQAMGVPAVDVKGPNEVYLVTILVDDSGSIAEAGNEQAIRDGVNVVREALMESNSNNAVLMCVRYLNGTVVIPFTPIAQVPVLDASNYQANGGTPLYDMSVVALGDLMAKTQEFSNRGKPVRSATLIVTDGYDQHSRRFTTPESVKDIVSEILQDETHIVSAMGIQDKHGTDFRDVFKRMGIQDKWILTTTANKHDIRLNFGTFSQTAARGSQGAKPFSQAAAGGFGQP